MRILAYSVALASLLVAGCTPPAPKLVAPRATFTSEMVGKFTGARPRVDILARGFLVGAEPAPTGYAYYLYLIFSDRQKDTAPARRSVAIAYLSLLNDVAVVSRNTKIPLEHMAVLFAPMSGEPSARKALETRDPGIFLDEYNYDRARIIAGIVQKATTKKLPPVSIVGLRQPIESDPLLHGELTVLDLTIEDEARAQSELSMLRDTLESDEPEIRSSKEPVVLKKLRSFFALANAVTAVLGSS